MLYLKCSFIQTYMNFNIFKLNKKNYINNISINYLYNMIKNCFKHLNKHSNNMLIQKRNMSELKDNLTFENYPFLKRLGLDKTNVGCFNGSKWEANGDVYTSINPSDNKPIANIIFGNENDYELCLQNMEEIQREWRMFPAPKRGEIVRDIAQNLREKQHDLGSLISLEMGKIKVEGVGEVQEFIDMAELAVGMSRQIPGQILPSERKNHVMFETWNPIGNIGIISAFNFPSAVAGWNTAVSLICGNTQIWKGAPSSSLVSIAQQKIITEVLKSHNMEKVATLCQGEGSDIGEKMIHDKRIDLISFTGSTPVGKHVAEVVGKRFGNTILELGGNNAVIVMDDADLEMALPTILFAAIGTAGQRCTTLRRLLIHEKIYDIFLQKLVKAYEQIKPGRLLDDSTLLGPLHNKNAVSIYQNTIEKAEKQGGLVLTGNKIYDNLLGNYVQPTLIEATKNMDVLQEENFVPVTYAIKIKDFEEAVEINNSVSFGLSSALLTQNMNNVFNWLGPNGSDCGIINVNTSCSGAEIGGAFGGNKDTGNGRESGSDSWKQYMRRGTCTINYGDNVPLAQGIEFN